MPIETLITSQKFFNQFNNGLDFSESTGDFTQNSVGGAIDLLKVETEIQVSWFSEASQGNSFTFTRNTSTDWTIERPNGSFADDGFWVGAKVQLIKASGFGFLIPPATIDIISSDGKKIQLTSDSPTPFNSGVYSDLSMFPVIDSSNELTSLILGFGIIGQNEQYNTRSKVSNNTQQYYFAGIDVTGVDGIAKGTFNDFVTGSAFCQTISTSEDYTQAFRITHVFRIVPYYLDGELPNLQNVTPPDLFTQPSLKYAFDVEFRQVLSNPNIAIKSTFDTQKGSIGWFNQNFNGFDNNYTVESIEYEDVTTANETEGLQLSSRTKATITVSKVGGVLSAGQRAGVFVSYLPTQSEYQNTVTNLSENFLLDSAYHNEGDPAPIGDGIIKSIDSSIVLDRIVLEVEIEYSTTEQLRLTTDSNYLIVVQIADSAIASGNSDRVNLIADVNTYKKGAFIEGLFNVTDFGYLVNGQTVSDDSTPIIEEIWNEDSISVKGSFDLDLSKQSVLERLEFALVAFNTVTNSYFLLDSLFLNVAGYTVSLGSQQISINETRGYERVYEPELFNNITITTGTKVGDLQGYNFNFAQKIKWQDWIFNPNADTVFYDGSKPADNLNLKSSNYSGLEDYEVKMIVIANTTGIDDLGRDGIGLDVYEGGNISIKDYGLSDTPYSVAKVRTLDPESLTDLGGAILSDKPTLVESRFSGTSTSNIVILHRYERTNQLGDVIPEIEADLSVDGLELVGRTLLSNALFDNSSAYNFTARLFSPFRIIQIEFQTDWDTGTDGNFVADLVFSDATIADWELPDGTIVNTNNLDTALGGFDGTVKDVRILVSDFSKIEAIDITAKIVGEFDVSLATQLEILDVRDNLGMTKLTTASSVIGAGADGIRASDCGITGVQDFSNTLFVSEAFVDISDNPITGLNFSTSLGVNNIGRLVLSACDIQGNLDLSNTIVQRIDSTSLSPNWTSFSLYSGAVVAGSRILILGANITGVVDLSNLTVSSVIIQNQNITEFVLSSTTSAMDAISLNRNPIRVFNFGGATFSGSVFIQLQDLNDNGLMTSTEISQMCIDIDARATAGNGLIRFDGDNPSLDASGIIAKDSLILKGYSVLFN